MHALVSIDNAEWGIFKRMQKSDISTRHKVLLVDDEVSILQAYKQVLGRDFQVDTAESGEIGLDMFSRQGAYSVVISDLRMPGMDGIAFLSRAIKASPESEFIIVTGYAEREIIAKAVKDLSIPRILVKPCSAKVLINEVAGAVERYEKRVRPADETDAFSKDNLEDETETPIAELVKSIVTEMKVNRIRMPVLPQIVQELQKTIQDPNSTNEDLAEIIEKDAVISLKLITVADSYMYRGRKKVQTVKEAVPRLGSKETINIVMTLTNQKLYEIKHNRLKQLMEKLWLHSLCCAYGSRAIAQCLNLEDAEKYFLLGLIHDIGKVLVLKVLDDHPLMNKGIDSQDIIDSLQEAHTSLGGILLRHWKFPKEFISVATLHEDAMSFPIVTKAVLVVDLANRMTRKIGYSLFNEDMDITSLGSAKRLKIESDSLENICRQVTDLMNEAASVF